MDQITDSKERIMNMIPGGITVVRIQDQKFQPVFFSEGLLTMLGYEREELLQMAKDDILNMIAPNDHGKFMAFSAISQRSNNDINLLLQIRCKDGSLRTCHFAGRWYEEESGVKELYGIFTETSAESSFLQSVAKENADGIYVIHRDTYELLYSDENKKLFQRGDSYVGKKCYSFLHGKDSPCSFCTLKTHAPDGIPHRMPVQEEGKFYDTRFRETEWNGIPAYAKYVQDVTEDVLLEEENARLEQYFQTVLRYLPGGAAVVRSQSDGAVFPEFLSDGFFEMINMSKEEAWEMYKDNALAGVHPDDKEAVAEHLSQCIAEGRERYEMVYRLRKGGGGYIWVKVVFSVIPSESGYARVYAIYHDITEARIEQMRIRKQYKALILQHYMTPGPNALVLGHCNITQNRILEIKDYTDSHLLDTFGYVREEFFTGLSTLIPNEKERQEFLSKYLNAPSLASFERGETEVVMTCYLKPPKMELGRYVQFKVNLVETPDTHDVTGILTVTDITEQTLADKALHRISLESYDFVAEINLFEDSYNIISARTEEIPNENYSLHSQHIKDLKEQIIPRDRERVAKMLDPAYVMERMQEEDSYSFSCTWQNASGETLSKSLTISAIDLRLGRVCLTCTDITESVREQQGLLSMIAYTFELASFITLNTGSLTMFTRKSVLKNLTPYMYDDYDMAMDRFTLRYSEENQRETIRHQFRLDTIIRRLEESPGGYDFVCPLMIKNERRYKQINVLWGDESHKTICLVRADITEVLAEEKKSKSKLEKALALAKEANKAKSEFLSSVSHDIRTPMNAIIGMTTLAMNHLNDPERTKEYLRKISVSSRHLLSLINNVLDMSQIEHSKIQLNHIHISMNDIAEQVCSIMVAQAQKKSLDFRVQVKELKHPYFYGDALRINQILINLLGNAFKFTPEGGSVDLCIEEIPPLEKEGTVRFLYTVKDTGIGMTEEFKAHLFDPFVRSNAVASVEGSGLGLSITKGLVDLMNGTIRVESRLQEGTTFHIELEHEIAQEMENAAKQGSSQHHEDKNVLSGRHFLVVEDNAINSEILCELLQMNDATSVVRENGLLGVQEFEHTAPDTYDAILMDIQMPVMNGYAATKALRSLPRPDSRTIPIVAMTANAFSEDVQEALEAGMNAHVAKPIDMETLCSTLKKLLD